MQPPQTLFSRLTIATAILATLAVAPFYSYDPINIIKMVFLTTGALALLPLLFYFRNKIWNNQRTLLIMITLFLSFMCASFILNERPKSQEFWGVWGRSTGFLTYFCLAICMLSASQVSANGGAPKIRHAFEKTSYLITGYTFIQFLGIDPINWSQKLMVATLGNINFMSSFLGLASISLFLRFWKDADNVFSKLYYLLVFSMNMFLIIVSNSIQGLAIVMSGCATALIFDVRYKLGNWASVLFTCSAGLLGIFTFLGTAGLGPLIFLRQETVIFRIDYWRAGLKMSLAHPFFGVGIDSYGDFYQQYRSFEATYRTGPERVTNTAHNIFLDIASGSGLVAGLVFLSIFFILFVKAREVWHFETIDNSVITFISLGSGYLVFCLISINQIGIAVWGFLFLGVLHGLKVNHKESKKKPFQRQKKLEPESEYINRKLFAPQNYRTTIRVSLFAVFGLFLSLPPLIQDGKMLQAVRHLDFDKMKSIAYSDYSTVFHRNKYTDLLISQGKLSEATNFSIYEIARNDRDFYSLKVVAFSEYAPTSLRLDALKKLESFDPNNSEFLIELMKIRESLTSEIS